MAVRITPLQLQQGRRLLCTQISNTRRQQCSWSIKQVTKTNFADSLEEIKSHISGSDFIAVSLQKTGSFSAPWHRVSPFDTPETAYLKAKYAAERFQFFQFAVCPFTFAANKLTAFPYNFHLFPRDELKIGMPSYSFSCQTSYLTSMAREGFDFNTCIYDGISYLSREQESAAKRRMANPTPVNAVVKPTTTRSVADAVFVERTRSRVKHWIKACQESQTDEALIRSIRKLLLKSDEFQSRPSMTVDVCSEHQVRLVVEMLQDLSDDLVPLIVPSKGGGSDAVRVVFTSSKEDKDLLKNELQNLEKEHGKKVRGFREVIDLISSSQKPVVSHNSLNDFSFIHSKFLAQLPPSMDEFMCSLRSAFPHVIDVNHLMKEITPLRKLKNVPMAISSLKNRFFSPIDMEIPSEAMVNEGKIHGHNVLNICQVFAKLCNVLKLACNATGTDHVNLASVLEAYTNIFNPFSSAAHEEADGEVRIWSNDARKVSSDDLVFLWGFRDRMSAGVLKSLLQESHKVFYEEFDVRSVESGCAIVVFWKPGQSRTFLDIMNDSSKISGPLREMVYEGVRAAGYETYSKACRVGLWEAHLADSLDKVLEGSYSLPEADSKTKSSETFWDSELMINWDEL